MISKARLVNLFTMTALLLLSSCTVQIKNQRWYGDEGPKGAVWFETLTDEKGHIDKQTWDIQRIGMACTDTDTFGEIKKEIEKLCSIGKHCRYQDVKQTLDKFQGHMDELSKLRVGTTQGTKTDN